MITLLARRELRSLFSLPSTWFVIGLLQFVLAWYFLSRVNTFLQLQAELSQIANPPGATMMIVAPLCNMLALFLMMITPVFSMRLIAEERRNGTYSLLLSSPISNSQIALGKFIGLLLFLLLLIASIPLMLYSLAIGTTLDHGLIASNILGLFLLTCCYVSVGLYASSLTKQPIIAAITTLVLLLGLWLIDLNTSNPNWPAISPLQHFQSFNSGLLHSNDVVYYLLFCSGFLFLTIRRLENNRWYG